MTHRHAVYLLIPTLATLASCSPPDAARGVGPVSVRIEDGAASETHRVTGGGKLDISSFDPALPPETYAFTASVDAKGNVKGQMQIRFSDPLASIHADVTCLSVSGRDAWIGIVVTGTDDAAIFPVGAERWVRVQDNGEGESAAPDVMSFFRPGGGAARCNERRPVEMPFAWLHGNIQVR